MGIHKQIFQLNLIRTAVKRNVNAIKHAGYPKNVFIEELKVELKKDMESLDMAFHLFWVVWSLFRGSCGPVAQLR